MHNNIPIEIRWLIEAKVRLIGEFSDSFNIHMPGLGRSSYAKKRRAKRMGVCYKCTRIHCNTRCRSLGIVSVNREDKLKFIKDGPSKESLDDVLSILETHPNGYVHITILDLWSQFEKER